MDEYLKIDDAEFALMLDEAGKMLETMSPEKIADLRALCTDELGNLIREMEVSARKCKRIDDQLEEERNNFNSDNPLKPAKKRFWLGQLANFIAVSVFRLPREFTPSYSYPWGSSKKFAIHAKSIDDKFDYLIKAGLVLSESSCSGFYEIKRKISDDDARLIVFCNSCKNIDAAVEKVDVAPHFRQVASLLYQNNVSFPVNIYRLDCKVKNLTSIVSSMIEKVTNSYSNAGDTEAL